MKSLKDILNKVSLVAVSGSTDIIVSDVCIDSRKVKKGSLFIAVVGTAVDGHQFIDQVIENGAVAIICEALPETLKEDITYVAVKSSAEAQGIIASNFYGNPSKKLKLVGITGTNGKTSTVTILHQLFQKLGYSVGMLSTVENKINEEVIPSTHTTPDAVSLNELLNKMVSEGCTHCFMEVSSHAIVQRRIAGLDFGVAIFSNISHDHLDYHKTFDEYIKAKKLFFDNLSSHATALINVDDKRGRVMVQNSKATTRTYSLKSASDYKGKVLSNTIAGLEMEIDNKEVWFRLIGAFNGYNLMAVYAAALILGEDSEDVLTELSLIGTPRGRFEQVISDTKIIGIVDYAHTPDALQNVLSTIDGLREVKTQVITVVGCGGNRDAEKRPKMAQIACEYSDKVILTSDNPRNEIPEDIIKQMEAGIKIIDKKKTLSITDRKEAIKTACLFAEKGDVVLIAGKGHETYQEIAGVKHDFDDLEVLKETFKLLSK